MGELLLFEKFGEVERLPAGGQAQRQAGGEYEDGSHGDFDFCETVLGSVYANLVKASKNVVFKTGSKRFMSFPDVQTAGFLRGVVNCLYG